MRTAATTPIGGPVPAAGPQDGEHLLVRCQEWALLRPIYMDGHAHPEHRTPTLLGHSGEVRGVERYTVRENPKRLELTLEDPAMFTKPLVVTMTWVYTPDVEFVEDTCFQQPGKP